LVNLTEKGTETAKTVKMIKMGFWKRVFTCRLEPITVNPVTNKVYVPDSRFGLLYVVDG
jgi:hypothetical protein